MRTESRQNGSKRGYIGKNSGPVQIRAGRTLLWTRGILPKSTTMAVSAHAQWQIRQKSRSENMVHLRQVHIQKRIVMYNFQLHTSHSHLPRCKINKQK